MDIRKNLDQKTLKNLNKNYESFAKNYNNLFIDLREKNLKIVCQNTGSRYLDKKNMLMDFLNKTLLVSPEDEKIFLSDNPKKRETAMLDDFSSAIVLHYLNKSDGTAPAEEWISYRELPDGIFYSRTIPGILAPILAKCPDNFSDLLNSAKNIGGKKADDIKNGIIIDVFKRFPVLLIYEPADDEFDVAINILFDRASSHHLNTDIIKTLVVCLVNKLLD